MSIKTTLDSIECEAFAAPNQSYWCIEEKLQHTVTIDTALTVRVYASKWSRYRGVAFVGNRAVSGVVVGTDGTITMRATDVEYQGFGLTNKIVEVMQSLDIECERSEFQTEAGAACYTETFHLTNERPVCYAFM